MKLPNKIGWFDKIWNKKQGIKQVQVFEIIVKRKMRESVITYIKKLDGKYGMSVKEVFKCQSQE